MTDTKTCRGVKSLLALLLTGMALLMMSAIQPVMAQSQTGSANIISFSLTPGGTSLSTPDGLSYAAVGNWTGSAFTPYKIQILVSFFNGSTCTLQSLHDVHVAQFGSSTSGVPISDSSSFGGYAYGSGIYDSTTMTGFKWHYIMTFNVESSDTQSILATDTKTTDDQLYGAFSDGGGLGGPIG